MGTGGGGGGGGSGGSFTRVKAARLLHTSHLRECVELHSITCLDIIVLNQRYDYTFYFTVICPSVILSHTSRAAVRPKPPVFVTSTYLHYEKEGWSVFMK